MADALLRGFSVYTMRNPGYSEGLKSCADHSIDLVYHNDPVVVIVITSSSNHSIQGERKTAKVAVRIDIFTVLPISDPKKFKYTFKSILTPHHQHFPSITTTIATTITTTIATAKLAI